MAVNIDDVVQVKLSDDIIRDCVMVSRNLTDHLVDRPDLHSRDYLERFINCLMGEIAEQAVIFWLKSNGKFAESSVDKTSSNPDAGHDIWVMSIDNRRVKASVKSSISAQKAPEEILSTFTLATTPKELRDINIQVYFWLSLNTTPRISVPVARQIGIFAWAGRNDLPDFTPYAGEKRNSPTRKLNELRRMQDLLEMLA